MIDLVALVTELETNPRYDASVRSGNNTETTRLLGELEVGQTVFTTATIDQVKEAIGSGIRTLTLEQKADLRFLVESGGDVVDFSVPAIRTELSQIFTGQSAVVTRLTGLAATTIRTLSFGEAFGGKATLNDVRAAVRQIAKAAINQ